MAADSDATLLADSPDLAADVSTSADSSPLRLSHGRFQAVLRTGSVSAQFAAELLDDVVQAEAVADRYRRRLDATVEGHFGRAIAGYQAGERHRGLLALRERIAGLHKAETDAAAARDVADREWREGLVGTGKPKDPEAARRKHETAARQHAEAADLLKGMEQDARNHLRSVLDAARVDLAADAQRRRDRLIAELLAEVSSRLLDLEIAAACMRLTPDQIYGPFGAA